MSPAPRYRQLPARLRWLIAGQCLAAGAAAAYYAGPGGAGTAGPPSLLLFLAGLGLASGALKVELVARWGRLTMAFAVTYFALLALGPGPAIAVNVLAALGGFCFNQREGRRRFNLRGVPAYRVAFNVANYVLCVAAAEVVFAGLGGRRAEPHLQQLAPPVLGSAVAYYLVNTWGVAAALGWSQGRSVRAAWRENFAWTVAGYLASACAGVGALYLYRQMPFGPAALFLLPPVYVVFQSYRVHMAKVRADVEHMRAVNRLSQSIITSLALAIDAKDRTTHRHIHRVREYAVGVAEELRVAAAELEALKTAALLHDIGKLGIPERILGKPDKLTAEEFRVIQSHVELGARILEPVEFPWPVMPIVLSHHERWDGLGYPQGLAGERIPVGGRIVAVVDAFDALTSDRPYRKALSREQALAVLHEGAGTQFDPAVVAAFERALPGVEARIRTLEGDAGSGAQPVKDGCTGAHPASPPTPIRTRTRTPTHSESQTTKTISRSRSADLECLEGGAPLPSAPCDPAAVLAWLAGEARASLPASTVCVWLPAPEGRLRVARSEGMQAERWQGMEAAPGEGAAGYVVERSEGVLNAPASLDLARRVRPGENLELSSALVVPLACGGPAFGALALYQTGYAVFTADHARHAAALAARAAASLAGAVEETGPGVPTAV